MTSWQPFDPWERGEAGESGEPAEALGDRFSVTEEPGAGGECLLRVRGELDHDTAPTMRAALRRCEEAGAASVLVDCSDLGFCDSTGLNLLLGARARAQGRGAAIVLVGMVPRVARVFDLTGAGPLFARYPTVAEARAAR